MLLLWFGPPARGQQLSCCPERPLSVQVFSISEGPFPSWRSLPAHPIWSSHSCHSPFLSTVRALFIVITPETLCCPAEVLPFPQPVGTVLAVCGFTRACGALCVDSLECWVSDFMKRSSSSVPVALLCWSTCLATCLRGSSGFPPVRCSQWPRTPAEESGKLWFQSWLTACWPCDGGKVIYTCSEPQLPQLSVVRMLLGGKLGRKGEI